MAKKTRNFSSKALEEREALEKKKEGLDNVEKELSDFVNEVKSKEDEAAEEAKRQAVKETNEAIDELYRETSEEISDELVKEAVKEAKKAEEAKAAREKLAKESREAALAEAIEKIDADAEAAKKTEAEAGKKTGAVLAGKKGAAKKNPTGAKIKAYLDGRPVKEVYIPYSGPCGDKSAKPLSGPYELLSEALCTSDYYRPRNAVFNPDGSIERYLTPEENSKLFGVKIAPKATK